MNIIETKNIEKTYKTGDAVVEALKDVNLTLTEGEILAIMGQQRLRKKHSFTYFRRVGAT